MYLYTFILPFLVFSFFHTFFPLIGCLSSSPISHVLKSAVFPSFLSLFATPLYFLDCPFSCPSFFLLLSNSLDNFLPFLGPLECSIIFLTFIHFVFNFPCSVSCHAASYPMGINNSFPYRQSLVNDHRPPPPTPPLPKKISDTAQLPAKGCQLTATVCQLTATVCQLSALGSQLSAWSSYL